MVMTNLKTVELHDQGAVDLEPLVVRSAVAALSPQDMLVPSAALLDISYSDHRLWSYGGKAHDVKLRDVNLCGLVRMGITKKQQDAAEMSHREQPSQRWRH